MEDVLDVYCLPYNPRFPVVCMDERPQQLIKGKRLNIPARAGQPMRQDYEYERNGVANIFMLTEPLAGWRHVNVTERRTDKDFAYQIKELVDRHYPEAEKIRLVLDNLNIHKTGSLYETFTPEEARRLTRRLEIHYTPKHGSWLNIAEIELSALAQQCLNRYIENRESLVRETADWEHKRNERQKGVDWQFTTKDARIKLKRLYPQIQT